MRLRTSPNLTVEGPEQNAYTLSDGSEARFDTRLYHSDNGSAHLVLSHGNLRKEDTMVRLASECTLGQSIRSVLCDCGSQLRLALQRIAKGCSGGMLIYSFGGGFEGRGARPENHFRAYVLHTKFGLSSKDAYEALGLTVDARSHHEPLEILEGWGFKERPFTLLTNNGGKLAEMRQAGFAFVKDEPLEVEVTHHNAPQIASRIHGFQHKFSEKARGRVKELNPPTRTLAECKNAGADLRVEPETVGDGIYRFGPVMLPLALQGTDTGIIEKRPVYLYVCDGKKHYYVIMGTEHPETDAEVTAMPACIPGDNFGIVRCGCRHEMGRVMACLHTEPQRTVLIYGLEHHRDPDKIPLDDVRTHAFNGMHRRSPIDPATHPDTKRILQSLGIGDKT
jgi:GTP cyclohydrolase II